MVAIAAVAGVAFLLGDGIPRTRIDVGRRRRGRCRPSTLNGLSEPLRGVLSLTRITLKLVKTRVISRRTSSRKLRPAIPIELGAQNELINLHPQMSPRPRTPTRLNHRPTQIIHTEPRTPGRTDPLHNPIQHGKSRIPLPIKPHSNGRHIHTHTIGFRKPLNQRRLHPIKNLLSRHPRRIHINSSPICSHIRVLRQGLSAGLSQAATLVPLAVAGVALLLGDGIPRTRIDVGRRRRRRRSRPSPLNSLSEPLRDMLSLTRITLNLVKTRVISERLARKLRPAIPIELGMQNELINLHPQMSPRPRTPTRLNHRPTQITNNEPRTPGRTDPLHNPIQHGKSRIPLPIKPHSNGRHIHTHTAGCWKPLDQRRLHPIKNLLSRHPRRIHINSPLYLFGKCRGFIEPVGSSVSTVDPIKAADGQASGTVKRWQ